MKKVISIGLVAVVICAVLFVQTNMTSLRSIGVQMSGLKNDVAGLQSQLAALSSGAMLPSDRDTLLFLGGRTDTTSKNDVFSTGNLQAWNLISPNAATPKWSARMNPDVLFYKKQYWIIGTSYWNSPSNNIVSPHDIWVSPDGINWRLVNANPPFNNYYAPFVSDFVGYYEYRATVLNDKMYVIGGKEGNGNHAVVWSSTDGITWTVETASAPFENRMLFSLVSHNGKMYVIGGRYSMNSYGNSGVWSSSDGSHWTQMTAAPTFSNYLSNAKAISFNDKIYLLGGFIQTTTSGSQSAKVWSSTDGNTWTLVSNTLPDASYTGFDTRDAIVANGQIVLGNVAFDGTSNKLWTTPDAITWTPVIPTPAWSTRFSYRFLTNR